jgi:hypothetical protein
MEYMKIDNPPGMMMEMFRMILLNRLGIIYNFLYKLLYKQMFMTYMLHFRIN